MAGSVLMPSAVSAEFRYIAPPAARAGVTAPDEGGERYGRAERAARPEHADHADPDRAMWRVGASDTLRAVLERWGARAGIDVLFLTDRRYRLHRGQAFEGAFIDAVRALFFALSHLPHPPVGELAAGGRSLAVTHRTAPVPRTPDPK